MPKIVEAVGSASFSPNPLARARAKEIEAAMTKAVEKAYAEGITDSAEIKARMMEAREKMKAG